jgi:predicted permease
MKEDLRYVIRTLRRDYGFATITVLILALGIAANTAVFSVVNTVLLRPLPFPDAHQLTWFSSGRDSIAKGRDAGGLSGVTYTVDAYEEFQRRNHSFQRVAGYNPFFGNSEYTLTGRGEPQQVTGVMVAGNFFETLQIQPEVGRLFTPEECKKGGRGAVLLSNAFWQRQFAGDPGIVGQSLILSKQSVTVVGVLPADFDFGSVFSPGMRVDVYVPAILDELRNWGNTLAVIGRLRPGVTVSQAQAKADVIFPQLKAAHPEWWGDYTSNITELKDFVSGKLRRSLIVLWCAVGLILLIVCVNVANLLLARTTARSKEFAMRSALGAGRARLIRQLLTEGLVVSGAGALLGLALAFAITRYLAHQGSIALPLLSRVGLDAPALAWTSLIAMSSAIVFGLAPGLRISSGNLQDSLKDSGPGVSGGRARSVCARCW